MIDAIDDAEAQRWRDDFGSNDFLDPKFRSLVHRLARIWIGFNNFERVRDVLIRFLHARGADAQLFWLDTDYGWVARGDWLLERWAADHRWDWRVDYDPDDPNAFDPAD